MAKPGNEKKSDKVHQVDGFAINPMHCPGCRVRVEDAEETCPECEYSFDTAMEKFPFAAPEIARFIDPEGQIRTHEMVAIDGVLDALSKRFPQPRFCFCIVDLEEDVDPREFGFWLLNASPVKDAKEEKLRPWTILLTIDSAHGRVSITTGYAIEPFLNEEGWRALLLREEKYFNAKDFGKAVLRFVDGAIGVLSEGAERTELRLSYRKLENNYPEQWWR